MCWEDVSKILLREKCTMLYFDMLDANGRPCVVAKGGEVLPPSFLVMWVVSPSGQVCRCSLSVGARV